jgi:hypothetical protein
MSRVRKNEHAAVTIDAADEKNHLRDSFPLLGAKSANQNDGESGSRGSGGGPG